MIDRRTSSCFAHSDIAFVRLTNRFPAQQQLELIEELRACVGAQVDMDPDPISAYEQSQQTISEHQARIRRHLRLLGFGDDERRLVEAFLFEQCCRLEQSAALRAQAEQFYRGYRPPYSKSKEAISAVQPV